MAKSKKTEDASLILNNKLTPINPDHTLCTWLVSRNPIPPPDKKSADSFRSVVNYEIEIWV